MFTPEVFLTSTLKSHPQGPSAARILASAFNAVEPGAAVKRYLSASPLPLNNRIFAFGLGKAACAMTDALAETVILSDALIVTKHASRLTSLTASVIEADHPLPGEASFEAGRTALEFFSRLTHDDLLICLISGGGSSLITAPMIPLADLQSLTASLLASGARVDEINTVRRHLDRLKGGGLAQGANGAQIISLILSDVVGDPPEAIASGPTAPDPSTREDAVAILRKYELENTLEQNFIETLKPNDDIFKHVQNQLIGSNDTALKAAQTEATGEGFSTRILTDKLQGEAREVGVKIAHDLMRDLKIHQRPFCLLAGGETTVTIRGNGKGGRNQELVLGVVDVLRDIPDVIVLSIATDGEDGPTDAAGAVASGDSARRAELLGLSSAEYLSRNDAYFFFDKLGDLIKTGPSGTNVNDLVLCLAF